jgi:hypothetical protein
MLCEISAEGQYEYPASAAFAFNFTGIAQQALRTFTAK